ncbi:hypothetical protein AJ79_02800 [Helicocarpus griseus UAMH5409]|uniref:BRCT domain-containing protein n=1 Tax=Helicocarpus griseus UAMH5409 TaxID=1447875 RepID=A0A2B7XSN2_9EURO|nr:hypothetical protein AJ79_02800 [Helicocarpus griseus UAMH5409]
MSHNKRPLPSSIRSILSAPSTAALETFDPWNSSSTGHQRAENFCTNTPEWQQVRSQKLGTQFDDNSGRGGRGGEWDWVSTERYEEVRRKEEKIGDIRSFMGGVKKKGRLEEGKNENIAAVDGGIKKGNGAFVLDDLGDEGGESDPSRKSGRTSHSPFLAGNSGERDASIETHAQATLADPSSVSSMKDIVPSSTSQPTQPSPSLILQQTPPVSRNNGIFANLTIYVNGSTSLISDHKLKHLLVSNGANISLTLARRSITHVILGRPNKNQKGKGSGGGLAATKLQQEIQRVGGKGVKFVGVEWVLESVKAGCRLPEARFATLHMAPDKQRSVMSMFHRVL